MASAPRDRIAFETSSDLVLVSWPPASFGWARMRNEIEVAFWIRFVEVDGGWDDPARDREDGDHRFESAGRTQQVPGHGLGRAHHQPARVLAEHGLHRMHFHRVTGGSRGAVGV